METVKDIFTLAAILWPLGLIFVIAMAWAVILIYKEEGTINPVKLARAYRGAIFKVLTRKPPHSALENERLREELERVKMQWQYEKERRIAAESLLYDTMLHDYTSKGHIIRIGKHSIIKSRESEIYKQP